MSVRLVISEVILGEDEDSEEVVKRMNNHLSIYASKHLDFSYKVIEDKENNKITVKTVTLDDNVN